MKLRFLFHIAAERELNEAAIRRVLLRRFPYAVMYSVRRDEIKVLAIANLKRRPFYWRGANSGVRGIA
jgi:hypothetical protein